MSELTDECNPPLLHVPCSSCTSQLEKSVHISPGVGVTKPISSILPHSWRNQYILVQGWGLLSQCPLFRYFLIFSSLSKHT